MGEGRLVASGRASSAPGIWSGDRDCRPREHAREGDRRRLRPDGHDVAESGAGTGGLRALLPHVDGHRRAVPRPPVAGGRPRATGPGGTSCSPASTPTVDWPAAAYWRELAVHYPDAKVILTVRDPEQWYESMSTTIFARRGPRGRPLPGGAAWSSGGWWRGVRRTSRSTRAWPGPRSWTACSTAASTTAVTCSTVFEDHVAEVQAVIPSDRLLVFDVRPGLGAAVRVPRRARSRRALPRGQRAGGVASQATTPAAAADPPRPLSGRGPASGLVPDHPAPPAGWVRASGHWSPPWSCLLVIAPDGSWWAVSPHDQRAWSPCSSPPWPGVVVVGGRPRAGSRCALCQHGSLCGAPRRVPGRDGR